MLVIGPLLLLLSVVRVNGGWVGEDQDTNTLLVVALPACKLYMSAVSLHVVVTCLFRREIPLRSQV